MSKSLGKQAVLVESFLDNVKTSSRVENRVVYQRADGTYECNYFTGDRRDIERKPDGSFYWRQDVVSLPKHTFADILRGLS